MRCKGATRKGVSKPGPKVLTHQQVERQLLGARHPASLLVGGRLPISGYAQNTNHAAPRVRNGQPLRTFGRSLQGSRRILTKFLGANSLCASMILSPARSTIVHAPQQYARDGGMERTFIRARRRGVVT